MNDVLDISRIEAGQLEIAPRPCEVGPLLREVAETVRPTADAKGLRLTVRLPGDLPVLTTDVRRVRQIVLNLAVNAVKFTEQGEVTLAANVDEDAVIITVSDTGPGIAMEDRAVIFDPFQQGRQGRARREGSGLGLAISTRLARLLGGALALESEPGCGATFTLSLPCRVPAGAAG